MKALTRLDVVKREEKEHRLKTFILRQLGLAGGAASVSCLLVARSGESPVVRALLSASREPGAPEPRVCALIVGAPAGGRNALPAELRREAGAAKVGGDPRLLEAHELLIIDCRAVWVGDCMRRDPAQTDSYECYSEHCVETAAHALHSFGRLWRVAASASWTAPMIGAMAESPPAAPTPAPVMPPFFGVAPTRH